MTSILALDGESILMQEMKVSVSMDIASKDQSGQTSSSNTSEQGIKPKQLKVTGIVAFKNADNLSRLFELATAKDSGEMHIYRVANYTAQSINLREAAFSGTIDVSEQSNVMAWSISFTLQEKLSVPELIEQRQGDLDPEPVIINDEQEKPEMGTFEKYFLAPVNNLIMGDKE